MIYEDILKDLARLKQAFRGRESLEKAAGYLLNSKIIQNIKKFSS